MLQAGCALLVKNVGAAINLDSPKLQLKLDFYLGGQLLRKTAKDKVNWRKGPAERSRGVQVKTKSK